MILVDSRVGSAELMPWFPLGSAVVTQLGFGDFAFAGRGPEDKAVTIGVERKVLTDFVTSMRSGRFPGHQLPGLISSYDYVYLLVEGDMTADQHGQMPRPEKSKNYRYIVGRMPEIFGYINTLMLKTEVRLIFSPDPMTSIQMLLALERWWNVKKFEGHSSHQAVYTSAPSVLSGSPPAKHLIALMLPGIGAKTAGKVMDHFKTVKEMVNAPIERWLEIPGIGEKTAIKIQQVLNE